LVKSTKSFLTKLEFYTFRHIECVQSVY